MTSPAGAPPRARGASGQRLRLLAVTACPTGIAHTYMAAEKLVQAAQALGHDIKVETQGSIGAENVLTDNDVRQADGVIIAADKDVDRSRFAEQARGGRRCRRGDSPSGAADRARTERTRPTGRGRRGREQRDGRASRWRTSGRRARGARTKR
ncbi:hypothetical protein GCM10020000_49570 [Streptomyces olivoverticillatus]